MNAEGSRAEARPLQIRNLRFDVGPKVPRHWHGGRRAVTSFFDGLSIFFPEGERFFVRSVRAHQRFVKGTPLEREVNGFCGQEGIHSREHERYNDMLRAQGYPVDELEAKVTEILRRAMRIKSPRAQLAATCALEHFTALMGRMLLADPRLLEGADPEMAALWRWHAAEENEHKSLAFDVYLAAGGNALERVVVMIGTTAIFWAKVLEHQVRFMRADGVASSSREWAELVWFLFGVPGGLRKLVPHYLAYFRPGFHPRDIDDGGLLEAWRAGYEKGARSAA